VNVFLLSFLKHENNGALVIHCAHDYIIIAYDISVSLCRRTKNVTISIVGSSPSCWEVPKREALRAESEVGDRKLAASRPPRAIGSAASSLRGPGQSPGR